MKTLNSGLVDLVALEVFMKKLNEEPNPSHIKVNNGNKYIPVGICYTLLDELFFGQWSWEHVKTIVIANELVYIGCLELVNPVNGQIIRRTGTAAAMIQMRAKDFDGKPTLITEAHWKYKNALEKDAPHAEADALKSACKKIGRIFGRDINRDADKRKDYESMLLGSAEQLIALEEHKSTLELSNEKLMDYKLNIDKYDNHKILFQELPNIMDTAVTELCLEDLEILKHHSNNSYKQLKLKAQQNGNTSKT